MSKRQIIMLLGLIVILLPFLGFPTSIDIVITMVIGILVIGFAYRLRPEEKKSNKVENNPSSLNSMETKDTNLPFIDHRNTELTTQ